MCKLLGEPQSRRPEGFPTSPAPWAAGPQLSAPEPEQTSGLCPVLGPGRGRTQGWCKGSGAGAVPPVGAARGELGTGRCLWEPGAMGGRAAASSLFPFRKHHKRGEAFLFPSPEAATCRAGWLQLLPRARGKPALRPAAAQQREPGAAGGEQDPHRNAV